MSIQDVRERPSQDAPQSVRDEADRMHARFADPTSDFLTILNLWNHLQGAAARARVERLPPPLPLRAPQLRAGARVVRRAPPAAIPARQGEGIDAGRLRQPRDPDAIHRALLAGLLSQIGILDERTAQPRQERTPPPKEPKDAARPSIAAPAASASRSSPVPALRKKSPQAVMAAEIVETSRTYRPHGRRDRSGLGRGARRRPREASGHRAALVEGCRRCRRLREGDAVRRRDHPAPPRAVRPDRPRRPPASCSCGMRWSRASGIRAAHRQARERVLAQQRRAAQAPREARGARAPPRHPRRRRGRLPLLRRAHPCRRLRRALVREVVARARSRPPRSCS